MTFPFPIFSPVTGTAIESHRYWRVNITSNNGAADTGFLELELYDALLGKNITSGGTASALQSTFGYGPEQLFDGSFQSNSGWRSTSMPTWAQYDFGTAKSIYGFGIHGTNTAGQGPKDFELQWSDNNSTWTTYITVTNQTGWATGEIRRFWSSSLPSYSGSPWGTHSYWRLYVKNANNDFPGLAELEFRATPGGSDQATGGTASASSIYAGSFVASNAFDDNVSTFWIASSSGFGWIQYAFASPVSVAQVLLRARNDGNPQNTPNLFAIQFADSSSGPWTTTINVISGSTSYTNGEARTFTDSFYI